MNRRIQASIIGAALLMGCGGEQGNAGQEVAEGEAMVEAEPITVSEVGFATPESVRHDPAADVYLVSNVNGAPTEADGNGFISRVSPDGSVLELKWIDGMSPDVELNAPKGVAIGGDVLYVTDVNAVRMFSRQSGEPMGSIDVPGATFLNDVAVGSDGTVYFTDSGLDAAFAPTGTDAVYRISDDSAEAIATGDLGRPNGVVVRGGEVWVVGYGTNELFRLEDGSKGEVSTLPAGGLDGLVFANGRFFVSSWEGEAIFAGMAGGEFTEVVSNVPAPADIGYDARRSRLLIPLFQDNEVRIVPLPRE